MLLKWAVGLVLGLIADVLERYEDEVVGWAVERLDLPGKTDAQERQMFMRWYRAIPAMLEYVVGLGLNRLKDIKRERKRKRRRRK